MGRVDGEVALGRQQVVDPLRRAVEALGDPVQLLDPVPAAERAGSPDPSRSAAPASSCSGRIIRRAYSRPSTTATPTASSASAPISSSSLRQVAGQERVVGRDMHREVAGCEVAAGDRAPVGGRTPDREQRGAALPDDT